MSLAYAILTALLEKPSSGLELTRRFDHSIGYFWSATHQQIYRELGKLEGSGFIRALPAEAPSRGSRKEYEVLPAGRVELAGWTAASDPPRAARETLLLRMRAAAVVGTEGIEDELERHLCSHRERLDEFLRIEGLDFVTAEPGVEQRLRHQVLRAGISLETAWVEWIEAALDDIRGTQGKGG
jgi:DNA-binding PadR family transcriptional regulator